MPEMLLVVEQALADSSQADPQLRTGKVYTRVTGQSVRAILADSLGIAINQLPASKTMRRMLKRNGFQLRRLRKTVPKTIVEFIDKIYCKGVTQPSKLLRS